MSASAIASSGYTDPNAYVPVFASENATAAAAEQQKQAKHLTMFGEGDDEPSFWDLLDVINPLQHIPIVNEIYQDLTGDKIGVAARLAGGGLFGGPIGLVASAIGCLVEEETGDSIGGHVVALFKDDEAAPSQVAEAPTQPVSPEPAKPVQVAMAAPVAPEIPEAVSAGPTSGGNATMMFSADGMIAQPAEVKTAAANPVPVTPAAAPMSLTTPQKTGRIMPAPPRTVSTADQAPPPIHVPISSGGSRSNVPITGRDPLANRASVDPLAVQKAMALQGVPAETQHPMLQASPKAAAGSSDWLGAMNQALDKYQKAGGLAARPEENKSPAY